MIEDWPYQPPEVVGPEREEDPVPVVPVDDAAVERVAVRLFARSFIPVRTVEQVRPLWDSMDDDQREFTRDAAREVLRAAGEPDQKPGE